MARSSKDFYASFTDQMKTSIKVGNVVEIMGDHPWAGSKGAIIAGPEVLMGKKKYKVRLFDTCDHECYADISTMKVLV
jgi:hypothetical protein